jgi:ABC-type multidrug transport system ATPase subunit
LKLTEDKTSKCGEIIATLRDVTVTYDGYLTRALTRVNLDFRRGEIIGVLGAKGAGKSSVLKILAGRLRPTEGAARVLGRSAGGGAAKARVGYLPGKVDSGRPVGFLRRLVRGKKEVSPTGRGVGRLTQAFLGNRDLLILDDPFADLEPADVAEAKAMIRDAVARGKTLVLSSDSLMEVKDICERLVILDEGKVQATGTLAELLSGGGAIRFLPAVLPNEMVERVLKVLREEISGGAPAQVAAAEMKTTSASRGKGKGADAGSNQLLTSLTKPKESSPVAVPDPKSTDPIDHGKLEELMKPKKTE